MVFRTESGSIYELDRAGEQVRRLEGQKNPTPRQGPDGEWKKFSSCSEVRVGHPVLIQWGPGSKHTLTSMVISVNPYAVNIGRN
jgi:hypothetical protein